MYNERKYFCNSSMKFNLDSMYTHEEAEGLLIEIDARTEAYIQDELMQI